MNVKGKGKVSVASVKENHKMLVLVKDAFGRKCRKYDPESRPQASCQGHTH